MEYFFLVVRIIYGKFEINSQISGGSYLFIYLKKERMVVLIPEAHLKTLQIQKPKWSIVCGPPYALQRGGPNPFSHSESPQREVKCVCLMRSRQIYIGKRHLK